MPASSTRPGSCPKRNRRKPSATEIASTKAEGDLRLLLTAPCYNQLMLFTSLQAIVIRTRDMGRAQVFYRDVLGLATLVEGSAVSVYSAGNCEVCLMQVVEGEQFAAGSGSYPNLRADHAATVREVLLAAGVDCTPVAISGPVSWFSFHDPDGNRLDCCQYELRPH